MMAVAAPLYALALAAAQTPAVEPASWAAPPEVSDVDGPFGVLFLPRYDDPRGAYDSATRDVHALMEAVRHMDGTARAAEARRLRERLQAVEAWRSQFAETLTHPDTDPATRTRLTDAHFRLAAEESTLRLQLEVLDVSPPADALATTAVLSGPGHDRRRHDDLMGWGDAVVVPTGHTVQDAIAIAADVVVDGIVLADAVAIGGDVHVRPGGQVLGDAVAFGGAVHTAPGAIVHRERLSLRDPMAALATPTAAPTQAPSFATWLRGVLVSFLTAAGTSLLAVGLLPAHVVRVSNTITARPGASGLVGALGLVVLSLGSLLAAITLIGLPLSFLMLAGLGLGGVVGFAGICHAAGQALQPHADGPVARWLPLLVGCAVLAMMGSWPWLLQLGLVLTLIAGLGASMLSVFAPR